MKATTQARQLRIIEMVLHTKSDKSLKKLEQVLALDAQPTLDDRLEMALAEGIADREAGRVVSHKEFMKALDDGLAAGNALRNTK